MNRPSRRILWCDAEANCRRLSTREGVADLATKAQQAKIDILIVDVKPLSGEVLYKSRHAPRLGEVNGFVYPQEFDLLQTAIEESHARGIRVHAGINVFSEGCRQWRRGPAYEHPDWQVTTYEVRRTVLFSSGRSLIVDAVDPWNPPEDSAAIYTRKADGISDRCHIAIQGNKVVEYGLLTDKKPVIEGGCVILLPPGDTVAGVKIGDEVEFRAKTVFRRGADSGISTWGVFVNPLSPAGRYELQRIREIVADYDVDGIVLDRMRYPHLYADFGESSRRAFEEWLGKGHINWPEDIFRIDALPWLPPVRGRYYKEWLEWRAGTIRQFAEEAVNTVNGTRAGVEAAVYVGSWYDSYFDVGVNWGSKTFHPGNEWMTPDYNRTGYAELFDYMCTGCYYPYATREDARAAGKSESATVEAACELSRKAIGDAAPFYGSLYLKQYEGDPEMFRKAIGECLKGSYGVMLFDLVYLDEYGWWPIIESEL